MGYFYFHQGRENHIFHCFFIFTHKELKDMTANLRKLIPNPLIIH
jgi:hypothetical protein